MPDRSRNYKKEYKDYQGTPQQLKRRAERNAARKKMERAGKVHKGDGKDVDHIHRNMRGNLSNNSANLRVLPKSVNRSRNSHKGK